MTGSHGEGCEVKGSDLDVMAVDKSVAVMYPEQCIPPYLANKTILYIQEAANCRPGFVHLELGQLKGQFDQYFYNSLVRIGNSVFISSDIYREQIIKLYSMYFGELESNGPSATMKATRSSADFVDCFPCYTWPKEARDWIQRARLCGWPHPNLIDKIVDRGCHLVPVGDKCSEDTFLQWRISFAAAERCLVHCFTHVQVKVYTLLKYFLKQIKQTLKDTIGDDDILCSYFLKTTMFFAIEDTSEMFWQDKNLFYCFWFCFNIIIAWVRAGFCPNYFIQANNMFQRKVHGQHQLMLLDILDNYRRMKWLCLSVGNVYRPTIWEDLSDTLKMSNYARSFTTQETIIYQDGQIINALQNRHLSGKEIIVKLLNMLFSSKSEFEEVYLYFCAIDCLGCLASELMLYNGCYNQGAVLGNKAGYKKLRKCKYWMSPNALMGTNILRLAAFYFMTGNFHKCLEISRSTKKLASCHNQGIIIAENMYQSPFTCNLLSRLQKVFPDSIRLDHTAINFSPLFLELSREYRGLKQILNIPPLPFILFLDFLCCNELKDTRGRDEALNQLIQVQFDGHQGGQVYWIVHTLLGICYQTLGDFHNAIRAYWASTQSNGDFHNWNTAIDRIAVVYLCMYASQIHPNGK
ncbi:uncharacterized protein [Argopecten irradians]|uniref:uncharacterized protein n=1 Tax=Argopecten irradians TaxID=31199 RepID=UPI003722D1EC